jgi:hypothetical protein
MLKRYRRLKIGGGCTKLQELSGLVVSIGYKLAWEREYLDLTELARLRWVEEWKVSRLADYFEVSQTAIEERLRAIKSNPKRAGLSLKPLVFRGK